MVKKQDVRWHQSRGRNFIIGFALSLSFTLWAFNLEVERDVSIFESNFEEILPEIEMIRTPSQDKKVIKIPVKDMRIDLSDEFVMEDVFEPIVDHENMDPDVGDFEIQGRGEKVGKKGKTTLPNINSFDNKEPVLIVEIMPYFGSCTHLSGLERKTCSDLNIIEYIQSNLTYPLAAKELNLQGVVVISFVVNRLGKIESISILKDIGGGCGVEAMRIIEHMPEWHPGIQNGKRVPVLFRIPVKFKLH